MEDQSSHTRHENGSLKKHEESFNGGSKSICKECGNQFIQKGHLRTHEQSVHGGQNILARHVITSLA